MSTRLVALTVKGLKGDGHKLALDPCAYLLGPNAAGKSRIFDALRLLVSGYHPDLPRTGDGIMRLAEGHEIDLHADFVTDDGRWAFGRRWWREETTRGKDKGRITVKSEIVAFGPRNAKLDKREAEAKILEVAGAPYAVDLSALLSETDTGRRAFLFRLGSERAGWTPALVAEILAAAGVTDDVAPWTGQDTLHDWLAAAYAAAKEATSAARGRVASCREAAAKLEEDAGAVEPADVGVLRQAHADASARQVEVAKTWERSTERAQAAYDQATEAMAQRRRAQESLDALRREEAQLVEAEQAAGTAPDTSALRSQIADLEDDLVGLPALRDEAAGATRQADEARKAVETARQAERTANDAKRAADDALTAARRWHVDVEAETSRQKRTATEKEELALAAAKAEAGKAREKSLRLKALLDADDGFGETPTCGECGQDIGAHLLPRYVERLVAAQQAETTAEAALTAARNRANIAAADAIAKADAEVAAKEAAARTAQAAASAATTERLAAEARLRTAEEAVRTTDAAHRNAAHKLADLRQQLDALQAGTGTADHAARRGNLRARREAAETAIRNPVADPETLKAQLADVRARAEKENGAAAQATADALAKMKAAEEELSLYKSAKRTRKELADAEAELKRRQAIEAALGPKGLMGKVVSSIAEPFEQAVNRCLEGLDLGVFGVRFFDLRDNEVCHFGLDRQGTWSPIECLSGGEVVAVHAAVLAGLANLGGAPWRVLLADRTEQLDRDRRATFLAQLVRLQQAGHLDQVLAAGCPDTLPAVPGLTVVPVGTFAAEERQAA